MSLAARFRKLRLIRDLKRETLSAMSGVPVATIRRFELQGEVSLKSLVLLAHALGVADQFEELFKLPEARSLDELAERDAKLAGSGRKRGRR